MVNGTLSISERIAEDRLGQLYRRSKTTSLALLVACTVYVFFLSVQFNPRGLMLWYTILFLVVSFRLVLHGIYVKQRESHSHNFWLVAFRICIFVVGITIGSLNLFFFPQDSLSQILLALFLPCGIVAASVTILVDFISFSLYTITLIFPIVYQTTFAGDGTHMGTGVLALVLAFFFLRFSREFNDNHDLTMELRYENNSLVEQLKKDRQTLENRLNRILNDSFSEIFVVDANSYDCLMVNKGAAKNLGYSPDDLVRKNLLEIFQIDRATLAGLVAPLEKGDEEAVFYSGYNRRCDGTSYPFEARVQLSKNEAPPIIVISAQDISERQSWQKQLIYQANYDQLTGLYNRHYMQSHMHSVFARANRQKKKAALLFMDIDNFKNINDSLGHDIGDKVLKQTAERLKELLRETDSPARTGGDEFTILIEGLTENDHAEVVARKLVDLFKEPYIVKEKEIYTTASVGISVYPDDSQSIDELMQYADIAMYQAKDDGRNRYRFFSNEMRKISERHMLITAQLRHALARDEFSLMFQPKIDIIKGEIVGAESLLRWHNESLGDVSPNEFIPLAEKLGLITEIGHWVLLESCREAVTWNKGSQNDLKVSVNVSPKQFRATNLLQDINDSLRESGLENHCLELEITENLLLHDVEQHQLILESLRQSGISLAMDDFGTGYSSLSYLKRFPIQVLKIDRSFIRDLFEDGNSMALVEAIIVMAKKLGLEIVAEGVENEEQLKFLRKKEVSIAQGYYFSPPIPAEKFKQLLEV